MPNYGRKTLQHEVNRTDSEAIKMKLTLSCLSVGAGLVLFLTLTLLGLIDLTVVSGSDTALNPSVSAWSGVIGFIISILFLSFGFRGISKYLNY